MKSLYTEAEVMDYIEENDVKFIRLAFCDIFGNHKNISILPEQLGTAIHDGVNFDSFRILGLSEPNNEDLVLKPDLSTLNVLPWRPQTGRVIRFYCNIFTSDGQPYAFDSRKFLMDSMEACKEYDFIVRLGLKSEFYLFKTDEDGNPTEVPMDQGSYFDVSPLDKCENIRREICLTLEEMGIQPESSHHEMGPGQNEIDFRWSNALSTADHFMTYKNVVGAISQSFGLHASFDPKPIKGQSGNGLHLKIATYRGTEDLDVSHPEMTTYFMAGIFNRVRDITVFLNSQVESYERFGENEAPKYITWSNNCSSRLMRVPHVNGRRTGFVLRSPDSGINPYLAFAMIIQAGLEGIRNQESLPDPVDKKANLVDATVRDHYRVLPLSLQEAIHCAEDSEFLKKPELCDIAQRYISVLKDEELYR